ncbi:Steryl acetyl hydrolase [Teratosphaeria destructans]|uniref:Steryl acetyl hydrolase n=1 Tax=Teratosphaeria destructans TaxID=418781 RepID=A0A9W7W0F4_9PEZI|nr:Steryl acetyl hydrolase [Teratosphaeria destructans]
MSPSKESGALHDLFTAFTANFQPDNPFLNRAIYDVASHAAVEEPSTTYESISLPFRTRGPAKWCRPANTSKNHVILFMHGGGYSIGSTTSHRKLAAHLAKQCNAPALMVDYRMTPEHAYPAALDDCVAAYKWLLDQGYSNKNIVVAGDSCGGGLSATVPLKLNLEGVAPPAASVALSPWYDVVCQDSESLRTNEKKDALSAPHAFADMYVADGAKKEDPLISPIYASIDDLKRLPPTWISAAGDDGLRDDAVRFAEKLKEADVEHVLEVAEGQQHVFEFMAGKAPEADESLRKIGEWVRKKIGS